MWRHKALESLGAHESCFYSRMHQCIYSPVSAASWLTKAVERVAITVVQISKLRYKCAYFGSHRTVSGALIEQPTSSASPQTLHVQEYFSYIRLTFKGGMTNSSAALFQHLQLMLQPTVKEASAMSFPPSLHLIFFECLLYTYTIRLKALKHVKKCDTLGVSNMHERWETAYICFPKSSGYESVCTTVAMPTVAASDTQWHPKSESG